MFYVVLLYALFASVFTIAKIGLDYAQPLFFMGARMAMAGLILLGFQYFFRRDRFKIKNGDWGRILKLAFFNIYLTNVCEFWGLKHLTSFKTCFIYSLSPFVSALISYFIFAEKLNYKKWTGLVVGFLGFAPILLSQTMQEAETGGFLFLSWAEIAVITAAVSSVYGWILLSQLMNENGVSPIMANGLSMLVGGGMALIHSPFVEDWSPVPVKEWMPFILCAGALILVSNLICYNLYGLLLKRYSATFMSFAGFTTPLFTALFGWFYLGEVVTWPFYLSAAIVFSGLLLFYQQELVPSKNVLPAETT